MEYGTAQHVVGYPETGIGRIYLGCEGEYPTILELHTVNGSFMYGCEDISQLDELVELIKKAKQVADVCEHNIKCGDWCEECNREYKDAAKAEGGTV